MKGKNQAFFKQGGSSKQQQQNDFFGGGGGAASGGNITGALKRAKTSGNLNLQNRGMAQFPMQVCDFANLKELTEQWWDAFPLLKIDMTGNEFKFIPEELFLNEKEITLVRFSNNKLESLPNSMSQLKNLKLLDVSINNLIMLPKTFSECVSLVDVNISSNQLQSLPENFQMLENLQVLNLSQNKLEKLPQALGKLTKLKKLILLSNSLTSISASSCNGLELLTELNLSKNQIKDIEPNSLSTLKSLVLLDLHQNRLTQFSQVPKSSTLDSLILSANRITIITNVENATNISNLDVETNKIETFPESILNLGKLKSLNIGNNDINILPPGLGIMQNLNRIQIQGNPLKGLPAKFRQASTLILKDYLKKKFQDFQTEEYKMTLAHNPNSSKALYGGSIDSTSYGEQWDTWIREYMQSGKLDLKGKDIKISINYTRLATLGDQLACFDFSKNPIQGGILDPKIGLMSRLQILTLNQCGIKNPLPSSLLQLYNLKELSLNRNQLSQFPCIVMESVKIIDLGQNQFEEIPPCFAYWPDLLQIIMPYNKIRNADVLCNKNFGKLQILDLSTNKIMELSKQFPYFLQNLNFFNIQNNELKNLPNGLGMLKKLKSLNIDGNPIKLIRRAVLDKGTQGVKDYLMNRYNEVSDCPTDKDRVADPLVFKKSELMKEEQEEEVKQPPVQRFQKEEIKQPFKAEMIQNQSQFNQMRGQENKQNNSKMQSMNAFQAPPPPPPPQTIQVEQKAPAIPQKPAGPSIQQLQAELNKLNLQIKQINNQIDNNFSLSNMKRNQLKRDLNHSIAARSKIVSQLQ